MAPWRGTMSQFALNPAECGAVGLEVLNFFRGNRCWLLVTRWPRFPIDSTASIRPSSLRDDCKRGLLTNARVSPGAGPVHVAVIGGTGLSKLDGYTAVAAVNPATPWGYPSAPILILEHGGHPVAFLARHGTHHQMAPHEIPSRANMAALRALGVRCVIAFSAVGSLQADIKPMDFVVPDQVIDRTKGVRPSTFFDRGLVGHVSFADPFDGRLAAVVQRCAAAMRGDAVVLHPRGTVVCIEGPQFSTRAESQLYRAWGGSVINMSALPEAKLAREAELAYQMICMATDYDCWHVSEDDVSVEMVFKSMQANSANAKHLVGAVLDELLKQDNSHLVLAKHLEGASKPAVMFCTKPEGRSPEAVKRMEYLFPGFFDCEP